MRGMRLQLGWIDNGGMSGVRKDNCVIEVNGE